MDAILQELTYDSLREGAVWPFDRRYIRPRHFHGQLECLLVLRGTATLHLGTRAESVRAGQLCWVLPGMPHVMSDFSPDFDMWVVQLESALVDSCWTDVIGAGGRDAGAPFEGWSVSLAERLAGATIVDAAAEDVRSLGGHARLVWTASGSADAAAHLRAFCELALRLSLAGGRRPKQQSVAELTSCLLLASPTTDRGAAAAEIGVSEGFLSRSIHRELGVTFVEHRARTRVAHFLAIVQSGHGNLLTAALDAGFGSYSQFHRTFTRLSGSRPRDYLDVGRRRLQLLVAGDVDQPDVGPVLALSASLRQLAPL